MSENQPTNTVNSDPHSQNPMNSVHTPSVPTTEQRSGDSTENISRGIADVRRKK